MSYFLLLAAIIIIICVFLNRLSMKLGIPTLLAFIVLGMLFGSDGIFKIPFDNFAISEQICSVALIFIMFYGGFGTNWNEAKPVAIKSILLSSVGVVLTAVITGLFCHYALGFSLLEGLLIGSLLGSTDAASVFSILRSKRLDLKYNTASLLELESGSNDPFAYMLMIIVLTMMGGTADPGQIAYTLFAQIVYAIGFSIVISYVTLWIFKKFRFCSTGFYEAFVLAMAVLAYALPSVLGGNGYLCTYIVGIVLGNSRIKDKTQLVHFFDGITGLMQMLIFFLLGLLAFPSKIPDVIVPALLIALFLTFVARPMVVFAILTPFHSNFRQQLVVSWAGLRGAASIVFAIMATISPAYISSDAFHIVFCVVLFSILLQGSLLPVLSKKLKMIDKNENVFKTFTDYTEETPIRFIEFTVTAPHPWVGQAVKDILLPPDTILVILHRGTDRIIPNGETVLEDGDEVVLSARGLSRRGEMEEIKLFEKTLSKGNMLIGKALSDISMEEGRLIIMVKRRKNIIIPNGKTVLKENDSIVITQN